MTVAVFVQAGLACAPSAVRVRTFLAMCHL